MEPSQVVNAVLQGQTDPHWIIFRYYRARAILMLIFKFIFTAIMLGLSGTMLTLSPKPIPQDTLIIGAPLMIGGVIGLIVFLHHIYTMFFLKSNMIVLTKDEVIKSVRGKTYTWGYKDITDLKLSVTHIKNSPPVYSIEFRDTSQNGRIFELTRGQEFGPAQNIYEVLRPKVS